jgi:hypothetical protein
MREGRGVWARWIAADLFPLRSYRVHCQGARESNEFDHSCTRPEYTTPRRVDFLGNPAVLVTSSVAGVAVSLVLGVVLSVWNPMSLTTH